MIKRSDRPNSCSGGEAIGADPPTLTPGSLILAALKSCGILADGTAPNLPIEAWLETSQAVHASVIDFTAAAAIEQLIGDEEEEPVCVDVLPCLAGSNLGRQ